MSTAPNPYESPRAELSPAPVDLPEDIATRREVLRWEYVGGWALAGVLTVGGVVLCLVLMALVDVAASRGWNQVAMIAQVALSLPILLVFAGLLSALFGMKACFGLWLLKRRSGRGE